MPQFPLMRDTVRAFGLTPIEQDRYEADDLIATYAPQARERGADVLIVSADKDLMQLIEPGVAMFDPASGTGDTRREERRIGADEVVDYFGGGAGQGRRRPGARRRFHRQCAGRARHRRQDRGAAHRRIWRSRNAARARRRDQAAQAPRDPDQSGNRVELIRISKTARHAGARRASSRRRSTISLGLPKLEASG